MSDAAVVRHLRARAAFNAGRALSPEDHAVVAELTYAADEIERVDHLKEQA